MNKFTTFCGSKANNCKRNEAEIGEKIRTNLEYFETEKQITAQRTYLNHFEF